MANIVYPGKAVHGATESSQRDDHESLCGKDESSTESLIQKSMQVTEGLKLLQQENSDLKVRIQEHEKKYDALLMSLKEKTTTECENQLDERSNSSLKYSQDAESYLDIQTPAMRPATEQNLVFKPGSPSAEELHLLAREIGPTWKVLGRQLRISDSDLNQIEADSEGHYEQCYRMLKRWTEVEVNPPTYEDLGQALQCDAVGRPELAEKYCCENGGEEYKEILSTTPNVVLREGRPNPEEVLYLAHEMKKWKQLGRALGLKDPQLDEIDGDIRALFEKRYAMLRRWMETKGSAATYAELAKGLEVVRRMDLIRNFCCENKTCELPEFVVRRVFNY